MFWRKKNKEPKKLKVIHLQRFQPFFITTDGVEHEGYKYNWFNADILDKKKICNEKQFYYDAGRTVEYVLNEADEEGCDAFNACIGGLNMFDNFIGLEDNTD